MRSLSRILLILTLSISVSISAQERKPGISKFFQVVIVDNGKYQYVIPDSLKNDKELAPFAINMWAFNQYLYSNYSNAAKNSQYLDSLLSDPFKLKNKHSELLTNDKKFNDLFYSIYYKKESPSIPIDSIQKIMARFFYLHKLSNGEIALHMCVGINEVLKMKQTEDSPFYNSFCFMVLFNQLPYEKIKSVIIYAKDGDSDKRIEELRNLNYINLSKNLALRQMIIDEYESKKDYLNFEIIY